MRTGSAFGGSKGVAIGLALLCSALPAIGWAEGEEQGEGQGGEAAAPAAEGAPPAGELSPEEAELARLADEIPEIVVTGTRIGRDNLSEFAHITVVSAKEIQQSGVTTVDELLTTMPSVTLQGLNKQNNNGGNGLAFVDLRNLGASRTLVLVNGRRFIKSGGGAAVDLNNIPVSMIERVEVLLDGASAAYGSDAIGGVINIILKDSFRGFEAAVGGGISTFGDGTALDISLTGGVGGEQGNVAANFTYTHEGRVEQKDRAWARHPVQAEWDNGDGTRGYLFGSGSHPGGRYMYFDRDGNFQDKFVDPDGDLHDFNDGSRYNFGNDQWLTGDMERFSATLFGNYFLSDDVSAYLEGTYTNRWSRNQLAPQPLGFGTNAYPEVFVPTTNPYMPAEMRDAIDPGIGGAWLIFRPTQLGRRIYDNDSDTFRLVTGVRGDIVKDLDFDVYFNYGHHANSTTTYNAVNQRRMIETVDPDLCGSATAQAAGCVVGNWFGEGNLSREVLDYIRYTDVESTSWDSFQVAGQMTWKSGQYFELPGGPLGAAVGVETRKESGYNRPSAITQGEESGGNGLDPTEGSYNAQEVFAELSLPLLDELPAVYSLTVDLAARFSHYNTFGNDITYRAGLSWAPIADVRLRGVFSTAFRAPDIADLYGGAADSYEEVDDPCNNWGASTDPNVRANCQAQGVPQDYDQSGAGGSQIRTNIGGNPNLDAETAMVANAGLVFTPTFGAEWLKDLSITFDLYWVKVDNAITNPNPQWLIDTCYESANFAHPNCARINARNPTSHAITSMEAALENIAQIETMGIDITLNYGLSAGSFGGPRWLRFDLGVHLNYLLDYTEVAMGDTIEYAGTITNGMTGGAFSHLRGTFVFQVSGESWSIGSRVRYIGGADIFGTSAENGDLTLEVAPIAYWDLNARYTWEGLTFTLGVDNLIGAEPPYLPEGGQNANVQTYDFVGRYIYTRIAYKF